MQAGATRRTAARNFVVSRGMGAAQGKKVARRRCAIAGRGEAGLRADRPYREAMVCGTVSPVERQVSPSCSVTGARVVGGTSVSRQHADRIVSVAGRTRWPVPCSLLFLLNRRDVDAGPPVTPVARRAFSALKLAAVSLRLGLYRASLVAGKVLLYPEPWSASSHATGTDHPTLTFWTRPDQVSCHWATYAGWMAQSRVHADPPTHSAPNVAKR